MSCPKQGSKACLDHVVSLFDDEIFHTDIEALKSCDLCVALLTGPDHDSGTSAELGYLYALGKPCIGITDDKRGYVNTIIWGICRYGKQIVHTVEELLEMMRSI